MIKNFRLSNGMRVTMEQMAGYRSAALGIWVKVGSVNETARENGMAHAIEHMVFKGTKRRTARELADAMTEIGDNLDAYTTKEYTCFYARTISEHLPKAIDILSDMLTNSLFDEDDLQRELRVIAEEIDMYDDAPEDIVHERLQEAIWRGHPLGFLISGDKPTIQNFRREDILTFMEKYYTASRMILTVSGAFDETQTLKQLEAAFGNVPVGETGMDNAEITMAPYQSALYCKHKDVEQVHINLGFESIAYHDSKRYVCSVVNNLLGGNVNSRLFQSVREEQGLAYTIYSYGNAYEKGGLFHIYAATQPEQVEAVLKSVLHIIEELKELPVTERELYIVKEQVKTELILGSESSYSRMNNCGKYLIHGEETESMDSVIAAIESVDAYAVMDFMRTYFDTKKMSLALVGDLKEFPYERAEALWQSFRNKESVKDKDGVEA